ncbi:MAG TPA: CYTH and CHAD domain-containing protein [Gaiellaceae bacterium]|nr:CYTH and CHAD domain-containing protein [Gaiellaceae bacterium]
MKSMLERERKFSVPAGFELPELGERLREHTLRSTYFDTSDYRLLEAGVTLRHRLVDGEPGGAWQLKLPSQGFRSEIEAEGDRAAIPDELRELIAVLVRDRELAPVATLVTERSGRLARRGRVVVAEVVQDRVTVTASDPTSGPFTEVEIELHEAGTPHDLIRIARQLRAAGAGESDGRPKLARALQLDPRHREEPENSAGTAGPVQLALGMQLQELIRHDPGTRLGHDPDELHDMRVAVRRLRAILRAARSVFRGTFAGETRAALKELGSSLGAVRDLDVLIAYIRAETASLPAGERPLVEPLVAVLEEERAEARVALLSALRDPGYFALLDRLQLAVGGRELSGKSVSLQKVARREHRKLVKAVRRLDQNPADAELHQIRIKAKHARYAAELAATSHPKHVQAYIKRAKELQDVLGTHQDAVVAERRISDAGRKAKKTSTALVAGRLAQLQVERRKQARKSFPDTWRALAEQGDKTW